MSHPTTSPLRFDTPLGVPLEAAFDAGRLTSDGGLPWLAEAEARWACARRWRPASPSGGGGPVRHSPGDAGPAAGVPDRLRLRGPGRRRPRCAADPLLKLVCGRLPGERAGPGQPADPLAPGERGRSARRRAAGGGAGRRSTCASGAGPGRPRRILLDLDGTADPAHGEQEGVALPRLLPPAHVPPAAGLRRRHRPARSPPSCARATSTAAAFVVLVLRRLRARGCARAGRAWRSSCGPTAASPSRACTPGARPHARRLHHRPGPQPRAGARWPRPLLAEAQAPAAPRRAAPRCAWPARPRYQAESWPAPAPGRLQGRGAGQGAEHPLRRHHPHRRPARPLRLVRRPRRAGELDQGPQERAARPTASATTASGPTPSACSCTPPPTGCSTPSAAGSRDRGRPPTARHPAPAPAQDRRPRPRARRRASALRLASSHPGEPLWLASSPPAHAPVNNPG